MRPIPEVRSRGSHPEVPHLGITCGGISSCGLPPEVLKPLSGLYSRGSNPVGNSHESPFRVPQPGACYRRINIKVDALGGILQGSLSSGGNPGCPIPGDHIKEVSFRGVSRPRGTPTRVPQERDPSQWYPPVAITRG
jgi:hypothetical protein